MKKPNVIYILADDMGYGDLSVNNENCPFETKHLDRLASEGLNCRDAHTTSAVCTPSRYGLLTGRYNWRSTLKNGVIGGYSEPLIEKSRKTVAHVFKEQGYYTSMVGKWHLGMSFAKGEGFVEEDEFATCDFVDYAKEIKQSPVAYGFDYYFGISASLDMPPYIYIENDRFTQMPDHMTVNTDKKFWREGPTAPDFVHEEVLDRLTDKVLDEIENHKEDPFFIYFPMPAPHTPILPSEKFQGKSGTNEYGDFVLHCDDVVGRVMNKLDEMGIRDNTIVIFTADNGCSPMADFPELAAAGHNPSYIFRGHKADIFEGGHRVPFLVSWPEKIEKNVVTDATICLSDFMRTMTDYFEMELPDDMGEDSVSNRSIWEGNYESAVRDRVVHQSIDGSLAIRMGRYKLEMCPGSGGWSYPKKEDLTDDMPKFQLYDLYDDISETINRIDEYPEVVEKMKKQLIADVKNGRSTDGTVQKNEGAAVWETIKWIEECC